MSRILIVDDEPSICFAFREFLADEGHDVAVASTAEEGLRLAEGDPVDAVVLDVRLPGKDGLSVLPEFRDRVGPAPIVIITAFGSLDTAVRAMEGGAFDYLVKPFDLDRASAVVSRALESRHRRTLAPGPSQEDREGTIIGSSPAMQDLFKRIALVAPADVPVLITGESGTGKELVARAIHRHSPRRGGPFVPVCLAALSPSLVERELFGHLKGSFTGADQDRKGLLELASGGTVLLDEIGDVPLPLQVKLLRALEHREITPVGDARPRPTDIRIVAATNRPLGDLMRSGQFREDLFFRLSVFPIHLPPLRDRREDIPELAEHFLRSARTPEASGLRFGPRSLEELKSRPWPGNIRELRNAVEHAAIVARGRTIQPEHLPPPPAAGPDHPDGPGPNDVGPRLSDWARREAEQLRGLPGASDLYDRFLGLAEPHVLRAVLEACQGNRARAARVLGIHRATLRQKLNRYGIG
ncbi:sigma-54-dependent transcriptional regulator [Tautonia sociabilis]|uniref:DNA-binding transcriptional regulator NtrC n=1 Tax=Tautonia sociabilis TaxID=2080755 RepID=A0A432MG54_9BACT|nr:sigma-54 dependent transcriptional regulator [Tautonia sociabilis]RUL85368.1 sigma-54-dependent Fis family transcriptional regulator [Tautonia sociabilis]